MAFPLAHPITRTPTHRSRRAVRRGYVRFCLEQLEDRVTPSTLIPIPTRHDLVYDSVRDLLYVTTSTGILA